MQQLGAAVARRARRPHGLRRHAAAVGLLPGYDPTDEPYYSEGNALGDSAGSAKSRLCKLLNRWNQKYDLGSSWSTTEI